LRILHVLRSPVGGLFRHVCDLTREQALSGHQVGVVCDTLTGGSGADAALGDLSSSCALGIARLAMHRMPHPSDIFHAMQIRKIAKKCSADILHGHGAKGGLYARIAAKTGTAQSVYTPHGGSLHYAWSSPMGAISLGMEKALTLLGKNYVFVCNFEKQLFDAKIGIGKGRFAIVPNGLAPEEFADVRLRPDASDFLFVGEMRKLKGVDVLLDALATLPGRSLTLVGDGSDQAEFERQSAALGLQDRVRFAGRMPISQALTMGDTLVVPSRNESFPYVVLEGAAAGRIVIASRVGGIPEMLPAEFCVPLVTPETFARTMDDSCTKRKPFQAIAADARNVLRQRNSVAQMAMSITQYYQSLPSR
jgi:glycosyltransferase involved in cell wall biosynthesis